MPDPEGPTNPTLSPRPMSSVMPRNISTGPALPASVNRASRRPKTMSINAALFAIVALAYGAGRSLRNLAALTFLLAAPVFAAPLQIVALGDSLTAGYGLPPDQGLVPQLQAWLAAAGADVAVQNAGVSGDTTAGGRARLDWSLGNGADALIVALGGNDLLRGLPPEQSRENLDAILTEAGARGLPVLLVGLPAPSNYGPDYKAAFDAMFPELASSHDALLLGNLLAPIMAVPPQDRVTRTLMQSDGLHPAAEGVRLIVAELGPKVLDLIARVPTR